MVVRNTTGFTPTPLSGGLNTSTPHTNLEPNESPDMMNMSVDFDGSLVKRAGITTLQTNSSTPLTLTTSYAPIVVPIKSPYGRNLLITRHNDDLVVYAENSTGYWSAAKTFSSMFRETAAGHTGTEQWNYTVLSENYHIKVIFTHPFFVPFQLCFYFGKANAATYTATTVAVSNVPPFLDETFTPYTSFITYLDTGVQTASTNYSHASTAGTTWDTGTWTFAATGHAAGTWAFEYISCTLSWWAEALLLKGEQLVGTVVNGVSSRDIPVPPEIAIGVDKLSTYRYPYNIYTTTAFDAKLTYTNPPTTTSQWSHSTGEYTSSGTSPMQTSPYWVTVGADVATARTLSIIRGVHIPFYGNQGADKFHGGSVTESPIIVCEYPTGGLWLRSSVAPPTEGGAGTGIGASNGGYFLRDSAFSTITSTTSGRTGVFITFDATSTASGGLGRLSTNGQYIICDQLSKTHYDNNRLGQVSDYTSSYGESLSVTIPVIWVNSTVPGYSDGAFPVFGISDYCNYSSGSFPGVAAVVQGRVALGAIRDDPLRVVFSNVADSHSIPGVYCNNFQTVLETEYDDNSAFDILLSSRGDDRITAMLEFNDKLVVWTNYKTFIIYSDTGVLTPSTAKYSVIAEKGCCNNRSVALMENTISFISGDGVYAIVSNDTSSGYNVQEISVKIRKTFTENSSLLAQYGWLLYDVSRKELYVGVREDSKFTYSGASATSKTPLTYVYKPQYSAWTQYSIDGYSFPAYGGCVIIESAGLSRVLLSMTLTNSSLTQHRLCEANNDYFVDLLDVDTWTVGTKTPDFSTHNNIWIYNGAVDYVWSNYSDSTLSRARAVPYREYNDLAVYWETGVGTNTYTQLVEGTQYIKTQYGIRLLQAHGTGGAIRVVAYLRVRGKSATRTDYDYPAILVQDSVVRMPFEYGVNASPGSYVYTFNGSFTPSASTIFFGTLYPTWITTPAITGETLSTKNVRHYFVYFDNRVAKLNTRTRVGVNIGLMYDDEYQGFLSEEVYGYLYDETLTGLWYDTDIYGEQQYKSYSRVMFPVLGSYQLMNVIHFTYSPCTFKLVGYELEFMKPKREGYSSSENQTLR